MLLLHKQPGRSIRLQMLGHPLPTGAWFACDMKYADTCKHGPLMDTIVARQLLKLKKSYTVFGETHSCNINQNVYLQ